MTLPLGPYYPERDQEPWTDWQWAAFLAGDEPDDECVPECKRFPTHVDHADNCPKMATE